MVEYPQPSTQQGEGREEVSTDKDRRNLDPHAEACLAMIIWSDDYAFKQCGGCMDFWDSLSPYRKKQCVDLVDRILASRRAATDGEAKP